MLSEARHSWVRFRVWLYFDGWTNKYPIAAIRSLATPAGRAYLEKGE